MDRSRVRGSSLNRASRGSCTFKIAPRAMGRNYSYLAVIKTSNSIRAIRVTGANEEGALTLQSPTVYLRVM
jgi:hypothetical protein